jgi:hypothetical protein
MENTSQPVKRLTTKQYFKLHPEKYGLVTYEHGDPIYILPGLDTNVTSDVSEALADSWDSLSNSEHRLNFYKNLTGLKELKWEVIG